MLIGRKSDLEWLQRQARLCRLILLTGVRGVGKTHLARHWLQTQGLNFQWFTTERFKDLPEMLGHPGLSNEAALEQAAARWRNCDLMVWDEVHLLAPNSRRQLLSFLHNSPYLPTQIFLSDEELPETTDASADLAHRRLQPFAASELREYADAVSIPLDETQAEELLRRTGGVPLLLRLWAQERDTPGSFRNKLIESLPAEELRVLGFAAILNRSFSSEELHAVTGAAWSVGEALRRKCLLEEVPANGTVHLSVPGYVRGLTVPSLSEQTRRELSARICTLMREPGLEHCLHALRSGDPALIEKSISPTLVERLEHLRREDLQELSTLLSAAPGAAMPEAESRLLLLRLELRALLLLGHRDQAIATGEAAAQELERAGALNGRPSEHFLLELVQILNRSGQSARARQWIAQSAAANSLPFQLEQAVSWMPAEPKRAQEILEKVLARESKSESALPNAQVRFQLARAYGLQENDAAAEECYRAALQGFREVDKPYFAAVTLLNLGWIALKTQRWDALAKIRGELTPIALRYNYHYALAGLELIEATEARLFLQFNRALQKAESSLRRLGASAPLLSRFDAQCEYIRALAALGLLAQAQSAIKDFTAQLGQIDSSLKQKFRDLEREIAAPRLTSEEWLENPPTDEEARALFNKQRGLADRRAQQVDRRLRSPISELADLELELTQIIQEAQEGEAWPTIARMERVLERTPEPMAEKVALLILQGVLVKDAGPRAALFDRAELELKRWAADNEIQAPLRAMLDCARSGSTKLTTHPLWIKSLAGARERWKRWLTGPLKSERSAWLVLTAAGHQECDDEPAPDARCPLQVIEHVAEVTWRGRRISEFHRRHALRKLLSLILEQGQKGADKGAIATVVWGESYDPRIHDARIYTAIQRLRSLLGQADVIQSWNGAYRWNPALDFRLIRYQRPRGESSVAVSDNRCQGLILRALERSSQGGRQWIARGELVSATQASEATVKRELSKLLSASLITRQGQGRAVVYSLRRIGA